jgi:hypothetical protein
MASGHVDKSKPLRPLSPRAWDALADAASGPVASHRHNAGVWDRLGREGLIEQTGVRGGSRIYEATAAGREKMKGRL